MSDTIVDMPKVTQMLDAGWCVMLQKNDLGSYSASATHCKRTVLVRTEKRLRAFFEENAIVKIPYERDSDWSGDWLITEDFTPEQVLTRLAYKVEGRILLTEERP